jgi:hypothetical protein
MVLLAATLQGAEPKVAATVEVPGRTFPFHVVTAKIGVENVGAEAVTVLRFPYASVTSIRIEDAATEQLIYEGPVEVSRLHVERPDVMAVFKAGEKHSFEVRLKNRWDDNKPIGAVFEKPGRYRCRFAFPFSYPEGKKRNWITAHTEWREIVVEATPPAEVAALAELLAAPRRGWLFQPQEAQMGVSKVNESEWEIFLNKFVADHPRSYWAPYANVALAYVYETWMFRERGNQELSERWKGRMKACIERALGKTEISSPGLAYEKLLALSAGEDQPKPPENVTIDIQRQVVKELEAKWYDIKSLPTNSAPWAKEYKRNSLQFYDLMAAGQMTMEEARRRDAEMLREYVLKHDRPLPPAEWKRRYEAYAKQEEERRAKQREQQLRDAPEAERRLHEAREKANPK